MLQGQVPLVDSRGLGVGLHRHEAAELHKRRVRTEWLCERIAAGNRAPWVCEIERPGGLDRIPKRRRRSRGRLNHQIGKIVEDSKRRPYRRLPVALRIEGEPDARRKLVVAVLNAGQTGKSFVACIQQTGGGLGEDGAANALIEAVETEVVDGAVVQS